MFQLNPSQLMNGQRPQWGQVAVQDGKMQQQYTSGYGGAAEGHNGITRYQTQPQQQWQPIPGWSNLFPQAQTPAPAAQPTTPTSAFTREMAGTTAQPTAPGSGLGGPNVNGLQQQMQMLLANLFGGH